MPLILVVRDQMATLSNPALGWELLTVAATFAGNLTLLGSQTNIIVAESVRDVGGIGFLDYLRVGLPLAFLMTLGRHGPGSSTPLSARTTLNRSPVW